MLTNVHSMSNASSLSATKYIVHIVFICWYIVIVSILLNQYILLCASLLYSMKVVHTVLEKNSEKEGDNHLETMNSNVSMLYTIVI